MNKPPDRICGVSESIFSVARYYGGAVAFGANYVYLAELDELVREDVLEAERKAKAAENAAKRKRSKCKALREQGTLFGGER